jgi:hypothetical protein
MFYAVKLSKVFTKNNGELFPSFQLIQHFEGNIE